MNYIEMLQKGIYFHQNHFVLISVLIEVVSPQFDRISRDFILHGCKCELTCATPRRFKYEGAQKIRGLIQ